MSDDTLGRLRKKRLSDFTAGDIVAAVEGWASEKATVEDLRGLLEECADECDELRNTLSRATPACVTRARAILQTSRDPVEDANVHVIGVAAESHRKPGSLGVVWIAGGHDWRVIAEDTELPDPSGPLYECTRCKRALRGQFGGAVGPLTPHACAGAKDPLRWALCPHDILYKDCRHVSCRKWMAEETKRVTGVDVVAFTMGERVHVLDEGRPLCRFVVSLLPEKWPSGHFWVRLSEEKDATCEGCKSFAQDMKGGGDV